MRDAATIQWDAAYGSVEDIVIDEYKRASDDVMARLDALGGWLAGLDADTIVDERESEERFAAAREPLKVWARSAKPRLVQALADLDRIRIVAPELRRPAEAYALASEVMNAITAYGSAADAFLAGDFDGANELVGAAHIGWRQMQARHGLASYV